MVIEKIEKTEKSNKGGKRPNSGRKKTLGSALADYEARKKFKEAFDRNILDEDWDSFVLKAKGDMKLLTYLIDQRIGKASQSMELTGKDGTPLFLPSELMEKYGITQNPGDSSK